MTAPVELVFDRLPALVPQYLRVAVAARRSRRVDAAEVPTIHATAATVAVDPGRVQRCRELLRYTDDGSLPPTFPQILAAPLHLAILANRNFPLPASGLVHLHNTIEVFAPVSQDLPLRLSAILCNAVNTARGIEMSMRTEAAVDGDVLWRSDSLMLSRGPSQASRRHRRRQPPRDSMVPVTSWRAEKNIGRRYARVSGDYNPIHLSAVTARPFGFRAAIAHGMWTLGRTISALHDYLQPPFGIEAQFTRPLLLPGEVRLLLDAGDERAFRLVDGSTGKAYLTGSLGFPASDPTKT